MQCVEEDATTDGKKGAGLMDSATSCSKLLEDDDTIILNANSTRSLTVSGSNSSLSFDDSHEFNLTVKDTTLDSTTTTTIDPINEHANEEEEVIDESSEIVERYEEEIQQLMYDRDVALNEAKTSKETLSCVMEAVQILTRQLKKSQ